MIRNRSPSLKIEPLFQVEYREKSNFSAVCEESEYVGWESMLDVGGT
jgi:hypothetical protein